MRRVRLRLRQDAETFRVEVPDLRRVAPEGIDGRVLRRVVSRPEARSRPEIGNAALGRHAGAGEDDARLGVYDQRSEMLGGHKPKLYAIAGVALVVAAPPRAGGGGVTVTLPPGWHATKPDQGQIVQPITRIVVSSGPIAPRLTGTCHVQVSDYAFPATEVAIVVVEWTKPIGGMKIGEGPKRPRRFTPANL